MIEKPLDSLSFSASIWDQTHKTRTDVANSYELLSLLVFIYIIGVATYQVHRTLE
jgi:hypothetical protein